MYEYADSKIKRFFLVVFIYHFYLTVALIIKHIQIGCSYCGITVITFKSQTPGVVERR